MLRNSGRGGFWLKTLELAVWYLLCEIECSSCLESVGSGFKSRQWLCPPLQLS